MRAHARTHTHACARAHPHTQTHLEIERETRARTGNHAADSSAALATHAASSLYISRHRVAQRWRAAPATSSRPPGLVVCGMGLIPSSRWGLRSVGREKQRGASQVGRTRRAVADVGARLGAPQRLLWRLLRVTSARSGRGVHGLRAAARAQARLCSCGRREVVWTSLASASKRGLVRCLAADAARAQTRGPQRHAHSAHDAALLAYAAPQVWIPRSRADEPHDSALLDVRITLTLSERTRALLSTSKHAEPHHSSNLSNIHGCCACSATMCLEFCKYGSPTPR